MAILVWMELWGGECLQAGGSLSATKSQSVYGLGVLYRRASGTLAVEGRNRCAFQGTQRQREEAPISPGE